MLAHLANPNAVQASRSWSTFKHRVPSFKKWGIAWGKSGYVSNQSATYHLVRACERLNAHFYRMMIRRYKCAKLPLRFNLMGFGRYNTVILNQFYLDVNWAVVKAIFRKRRNRYLRKNLSVRVLLKRKDPHRFDRMLNGVRVWEWGLIAPRRFAIEEEYQENLWGRSEPLDSIESGDIARFHGRSTWKKIKKKRKVFIVKTYISALY